MEDGKRVGDTLLTLIPYEYHFEDAGQFVASAKAIDYSDDRKSDFFS